MHLAKHMERNGGSPDGWLDRWSVAKRLDRSDRTYHEVATIVRVLRTAGCYDQLNISALASYEILSRRLNAIIDAYATVPNTKPNWGAVGLFGAVEGLDDGISEELQAFIGRRAKERLDVQATRNRARQNINGPGAGQDGIENNAEGAVPAVNLKVRVKQNNNQRRKGDGKGLVAPPEA
jgi:hypothetical protein